MAYSGPKVAAGISGQTLTSIPQQWSAQWFREFCLNYLQYADIRNATPGTGITISGNIGTPAATLSVNTEVQSLFGDPFLLAAAPANAYLTDYRLIAAEAGVLTVTDGGALGDLIVGVAANGIGNAQIRQGAALSVIGNASGTVENVADIAAGANPGYVLSVNAAGTALAWQALTAAQLPAIANDTVLGNVSGSTGAPTALTEAQLASLITGLQLTWTAAQTITPSTGVTGLAINAAASQYAAALSGNATAGDSFGLYIAAGTNSSDYALNILNAAANASYFVVYGDGGVAIGSPTGGDKGAGTLNLGGGMAGAYFNGTALQALAPTWTGAHVFSAAAATAIAVTINQEATGANALIVNGVDGGNPVLLMTSGSTHGLAMEIGHGGSTIDGWFGAGPASFAGAAIGDVGIACAAGTLRLGYGASGTTGLSISNAGLVTVGPVSTAIGTSATSKAAFYGVTPVVQRASTSIQRTSNLSSVTGTMSVSTAAFNQLYKSLGEVMATLAAYGLWSIS